MESMEIERSQSVLLVCGLIGWTTVLIVNFWRGNDEKSANVVHVLVYECVY